MSYYQRRALILLVASVVIPGCGGGGHGARSTSTGTGGSTGGSAGGTPGDGSGGANVAPTISITSPASGTNVPQGTSIPISTNASDSDGTVVRVDFLQGDTLIGTATQPPFTFVWQGAPAGSLKVTAVATDNAGASTTSAPVSITVTSSGVGNPGGGAGGGNPGSGGGAGGSPGTPSGWFLSSPAGLATDLSGVFFADVNLGWVVGANGTILRTGDGGATWSAQPSGTSAFLNRVQFVSATRGWIVGYLGTILSTSNGGQTWSNVSPPPSSTSMGFAGLSFVNETTGWVVGGGDSGGIVLKTTDGGATWTSLLPPDPNGTYGAVSFADTNHGFVGADGAVLSTTDGGATWSRRPMTVPGVSGPFPMHFHDARFMSASAGTFVGGAHNGDTIITTSDAGATWTTLRLNPPVDIFTGVAFGDGRNLWVVGSSGHVYWSRDRGITWSAQVTPTSNELNGVWFVDALHGWAVGFNGMILRTTTGGQGGT